MATRTAALEPAVAGVQAGSHWRTRTVAVVLLLAIGGYFWGVSRYPALYKKYSAGTQVKVTGAITFGTVLPVTAGMPLAQRVWRTSINWLQANEIGMTFGFFFGAAALTVLATMPRRRTGNAYVNSLLGAAVGMPLGVCANCVAPIGRGLYASGMSAESTLAAMFSSPTLNVVVLAMAFALFPLPIVGLKLATMLAMIFVFADGGSAEGGGGMRDRGVGVGDVVASSGHDSEIVCEEFLVCGASGLAADGVGGGAGGAGGGDDPAERAACSGDDWRDIDGSAGGNIFAGADGV